MDSVDFSENLKIVNIFKSFSTKYATSYVHTSKKLIFHFSRLWGSERKMQKRKNYLNILCLLSNH